MRKTKAIKIDDREITVKELTVRQVWDLLQGGDDQSPIARLQTLLELSCPELSMDAAMDMAPSELAQVWAVFQEVNSDFLGLAKKMGLDAMLEQIKESIRQDISAISLTAPSVL